MCQVPCALISSIPSGGSCSEGIQHRKHPYQLSETAKARACSQGAAPLVWTNEPGLEVLGTRSWVLVPYRIGRVNCEGRGSLP